MSPHDAARLTSYVQQNSPHILHQLMGPGGLLSSPQAKMAAAGIVSLAAKQFIERLR